MNTTSLRHFVGCSCSPIHRQNVSRFHSLAQMMRKVLNFLLAFWEKREGDRESKREREREYCFCFLDSMKIRANIKKCDFSVENNSLHRRIKSREYTHPDDKLSLGVGNKIERFFIYLLLWTTACTQETMCEKDKRNAVRLVWLDC